MDSIMCLNQEIAKIAGGNRGKNSSANQLRNFPQFHCITTSKETTITRFCSIENSVEVGDGHRIKYQGVCQKVRLQLQGLEVQQRFLLVQFRRSWHSIGNALVGEFREKRANFKKLTVKFDIEGKLVELKEEPALSKTASASKSMIKALCAEGKGYYYVAYKAIRGSLPGNAALSGKNIEDVLNELQIFFQDPQDSHVSRRPCNIVLQEGAEIPNLRPYRHPQYQMAEIEKAGRWDASSWNHSASITPYSSPIICQHQQSPKTITYDNQYIQKKKMALLNEFHLTKSITFPLKCSTLPCYNHSTQTHKRTQGNWTPHKTRSIGAQITN